MITNGVIFVFGQAKIVKSGWGQLGNNSQYNYRQEVQKCLIITICLERVFSTYKLGEQLWIWTFQQPRQWIQITFDDVKCCLWLQAQPVKNRGHLDLRMLIRTKSVSSSPLTQAILAASPQKLAFRKNMHLLNERRDRRTLKVHVHRWTITAKHRIIWKSATIVRILWTYFLQYGKIMEEERTTLSSIHCIISKFQNWGNWEFRISMERQQTWKHDGWCWWHVHVDVVHPSRYFASCISSNPSASVANSIRKEELTVEEEKSARFSTRWATSPH